MADLKLVPDSKWPGKAVDPYVRLAVAMVETEGDPAAMLGSEPGVLELLLELKAGMSQTLLDELEVPKAYKGARHVTATMSLKGPKPLRERIDALHKDVLRLKLAVRQQPRLDESLRDMGPGDPPWGKVGNDDLDGEGVIVGVIDDGCAFAHRNFLRRENGASPVFKSRVLFLWDQSGPLKKTKGEWITPPDFGYGSELDRAKIDEVIKSHVSGGIIDEDKIYEAIDYTVVPGSHGTHVLDIAAGNSESAVGSRGVAPAADIIFVQIPRISIGHPADSALSSYILDGVLYVFERARELNRPAVVNISYGGYGGPHDGTSLVERGIDELLEKADNRAVVISAGNSFNADCHASGNIKKGKKSNSLTWIVGEDDPTLNLLEIWYNQDAELSVTLTPPDGPALDAVPVNGAYSIRQADGLIVGWVFHRTGDPGNNANHVVIALRPSDAASKGSKVAPAPSGHWKVQLANVGQVDADFHAWIERDDAGSRKLGLRMQSRFAAAHASPRCTLGSLATGKLTISVGAYNTATQEVCEYSACGPTRDNPPRSKPDVCAPAEEDESGDGVLSATALSSQPTPMNGTSAAAPHVAGLVALMFQWAKGKPLSAAKILEIVREGAKRSTQKSGRKLKPHHKWPENEDFVTDSAGDGKVNAKETIAVLATMLNP